MSTKPEMMRKIFIFLIFMTMLLTGIVNRAEARAGGGSNYYSGIESGSESLPESKVLPAEEPDSGRLQPENADKPGPNAAELFKDTKVSDDDLRNFYWFGVLSSGFLIFCSTVLTLVFVYIADRKDSEFLRDRLFPLLFVNISTMLMAGAVVRAFSLSWWGIMLGMAVSLVALVGDGYLSWKSAQAEKRIKTSDQ
ncbi:MAG: hypothetical protein ACOYXC_14660 [Candidatus Rifleibacteriota bacterium]